MNFSLGPAETEWRDRVRGFMDEHVRPRTADHDAQQREGERWKVLPVIEEVKDKARAEGLWNLFMPPSHGAAQVDDSFEFDGSVLPIRIATLQRGSPAPLDHHLRPLITYSPPSRSMLQRMFVASDEATSGSVIRKADRISPSISGRSHASFCSRVP